MGIRVRVAGSRSGLQREGACIELGAVELGVSRVEGLVGRARASVRVRVRARVGFGLGWR